MTAIIHLIRHAESVHNIEKDFSRRDPGLTERGFEQAAELQLTFSQAWKVGLVITSPLRRTIQTTLKGFSNILDKAYYDANSGMGIDNGALLILDPGLQERSALQCDIGSETTQLTEEFPCLDFSKLEPRWLKKEGYYAPDDHSIEIRAADVRGRLSKRALELRGREKDEIVVVTHGVFMKFLSEDPSIDLPKAGWKSYSIQQTNGEKAVLSLI